MKFTTLLLAAVASVMVAATPLAAPQDTSTNLASGNAVLARADCNQCKAKFTDCMLSFPCWLNPDGCRISCRREMCQALKECREHCPADCPPKAVSVSARDDCKKCDDFYNKCRGSPWCWLNPYGCDVSCRADTCRKNGDDCRNKCGYQC